VTELPLSALVPLLAWGVVVGLDLVSVPQGLLSRPLVAATVAGWLAGNVEAGMRAGAIVELFALDVLPVGASRYPEYGPAAVGAAVLSAGLPQEGGAGVGALLGLLVALPAGWTLEWLRHANARHVHRMSAALSAGSVRAIRTLQWSGLARDALRSALVTTAALGLALALRVRLGPEATLPALLTPVLVGTGAAAALSGAVRTAGSGRRLAWVGIGLAAGLAAAVVMAVAA
jgi:PTS system mannose-specific IIC component